MPQPLVPWMPAVQLAISVAPRATLSYSVEGATAAALDYVKEEEEEISFHELHACCVQAEGVSWQDGGSSWQVAPGPATELELADVTWRTVRWLKDCKSECREEELVWWPLVCPLTAWSDKALCGLTGHLLVAWKWTLAAYKVSTCPPTPNMLNIGQFLNEAQVGETWSEQQWLEAYARALQHIGEAAEGRKWVCVDKNFTPRVSLLVKAFLGVLDMDVRKDHAMDCWGNNPSRFHDKRMKVHMLR